jgi:hypothetical protein
MSNININNNQTTNLNQTNPVFESIIAAAAAQSKYMKIQDGQTVVLKFSPDKVKLVDRTINDKKSKAAEYEIINVNDGQAKVVTFSLSWALNLNELLKAGYTTIKVNRRGSGLSTSYSFVPVG